MQKQSRWNASHVTGVYFEWGGTTKVEKCEGRSDWNKIDATSDEMREPSSCGAQVIVL